MSELERLLAKATLEPGHGPAFYRALLSNDVFALIPSGEARSIGGAVRYVMWTGEDGLRIVPFFASRAAACRAQTKATQVLRVDGHAFLDSCRGATVVLNPNESYTFRLAPDELERLVATGSPDAAEQYVTQVDQLVEFRAPDAPATLLDSLIVLFAQHPGVHRAHLVSMTPLEGVASPVWLLALRLDDSCDADRLASEVSAVLACAPPDHTVDLMRIDPGSPFDLNLNREMDPFYEKAPSA